MNSPMCPNRMSLGIRLFSLKTVPLQYLAVGITDSCASKVKTDTLISKAYSSPNLIKKIKEMLPFL